MGDGHGGASDAAPTSDTAGLPDSPLAGMALGASGLGDVGLGDVTAPLDTRLVGAELVYRALFENAADAIVVADDDGHYLEVNTPASDLLGYTREELLDMSVADIVAAGPDWARSQFAAFTGDGTWRGELRLRRKDGSLVPVESHASTVQVGDGRVHVAILRDITERVTARQLQSDLLRREQEARRAAESARQHLELVSDISELLAEWTDYPTALTRLAGVLVQRFADICVIDLVDEYGRIRRAAAVHADPARQPLVDRLRDLAPLDADAHPSVSAIRGGRPVVAEYVEPALLDATLPSGEARALVRALGYASFVSVPLVARQRVIGAISLVATTGGRPLTAGDVPVVEEIARRAAVRIDNARLYAERDEIARALQTALLPPRLPDLPGVRLAARYETADRARVGGDFYDVIELPDGSALLVIGDVRGKGPEAAAVTGLARHTIRGVSIRERRPAHLLRALNAVLVADDTSRFVTASCIRLDPRTGEAAICVAGHPAPLLVRNREVSVVACPTGLLLGEFPEVPLEEATVTLTPGDALVLYTDGLLGGGGDVDHLVRQLGTGDLPRRAGELVDRVLASAPNGGPTVSRIDDVAILAAVRVEGDFG